MLAEKDDECKYPGESGQNNRQKGEGCENRFPPLSVSRQNVRQGYPEHGGRQEHKRAQEQGISKGFQVIRVSEEFQVIVYAPVVGSGDLEAFQYQN
jgi:hypothetical protein